MNKQALSAVSITYAANHSIAIAVAVLCATSWQLGMAQTGPSTAKALVPGERNLQVQAAAPPGLNNSQRIALVIGNSAYTDAPLANPVNDARAIVKALQESGFSVIVRENVDQRGMLQALREFGDRLRAGGTGLFYYAGHGMQIKGRNYLIPVGSHIDREDEVAYSAVDAQAVLDKMEAAGNVANIMILDACRNNPFARSMRSGQAGLAQMDAPVGTLLAYATSPGAVASDGNGANGLYTQHLLNAIAQPGNKVEDVFKQVRANVRRDSQGKQVPWESTSLEGDFYFRATPVALLPVAPPQVDPSTALETALWDAVKGSNLPIEVRAYLGRYPTGRFVAQANARLAQLLPVPAVVTATVAPLPAPAPRPVPISSPEVTPVAAHNDEQAAIDQRTAEILASLTSTPGPGQLVVPAVPVKTRPQAAKNSFGISVGDRWRYQTVDKFKKEVVSNWSRVVEAINIDGSLKVNGGSIQWASDGALKSLRGADGFSREYSPAMKIAPSILRVGYSEPFKHALQFRNVNGDSGMEERDVTLTVLAKEIVKVPAGEFEAWRIEAAGTANGKFSNKSGQYFLQIKATNWYVPSLRNFVAQELDVRGRNGQLVTFERQELTSFSVREADKLAQR